jgi:sugar fermentation stimulation protein A
LRREVEDRGSYLLLLRLEKGQQLDVGSLGSLRLEPGHYIYVGSAMRNLSARVARHSRRRKTFHWHVDFLRNVASECTALPIRSSRREECEIARAFAKHFEPGPEGFGSSDCDCPAHLFFHPTNLLENAVFHRILQRFRMRAPERPANKAKR